MVTLEIEMQDTALRKLDVVRDFVNTLDLEENKEGIATPAQLGAWLGGRGLISEGSITTEEYRLAVETRETIRRLLLANNGGEAAAADLAELDRLADRAALAPRFHAGGVRLEPGTGGVVGALGLLLATVAEAMAEGTWTRLKACSEHSCMWAFYDRSKNRSGHWCSMRVCGNRAKARQFRERRRAESSAG
ncbi:MAG: CGNR zinc finger domain-containing protein [Candidatus Dormibacteraeota bacterium]|nr:CGNR zinc finger domain-containing protein [Candidatus Dormibacteraeota bacterium]